MGDFSTDETVGVIWNFDNEESKLIFSLRALFIEQLYSWELENSFWTLRKLANECKMFSGETEKKSIIQHQKEVDKKRLEVLNDNIIEEDEKIPFCLEQEKFYNFLNTLIKKHKLCFREERTAGRI